jgi:phenylalanyl-tRNA synthetase beta subunit
MNLAAEFGVPLEFRPIGKEEDYPVAKPYDPRRSAQIFAKGTDIPLGMIGEYKSSVRRGLKLPEHTAGFGIGLLQLQQATEKITTTNYAELPRFPKVTQDITLKVPASTNYADVYSAVWSALAQVQSEHSLPSLGPVAVYQSPDDTEHKNVTLRFVIASYDRTLTDTEVNTMLDAAAAKARDELGAERI